ncbi:hypothetical protein [Pseudoxanthomonas putridarboris]|uniref:Uncharacterized protein n=1 Tax=Pseudoxanthomonas putridarboris TaxID=752605 RepID=A0ABU9J330_9GAMM
MSPALRRPPRWLSPVFLLLGGLSFVLIWVMLALYLQKQVGWMALLAAVDVVLMLRLGGMARGTGRSVLALLATLAVCALALWGIVATQLGFSLGLGPWDSALRLGAHHAWTLTTLANGTLDWIALALAPLLAAWLAR